jgi:hypothetical protein
MTTTMLLASLVLTLSPSASRSSESGPVPTLRELCAGSDAIVVAEVGRHDPTESFVELSVYEVLKGVVSEYRVRVSTEWHVICPPPPRYETGEVVLAFLTRGEGARYRTHRGADGCKSLEPESLRVHTERVREWLAIEGAPLTDVEHRFAEIEWLVKCAEHPATRREGTYELERETELFHPGPVPAFGFLKEEQRSRLLDAVFTSSILRHEDLRLLELVAGDDPRVVPFLVRHLREMATASDLLPHEADGVLLSLVRHGDRPQSREYLARYRELSKTRSKVVTYIELEDYRAEKKRLLAGLLALYADVETR